MCDRCDKEVIEMGILDSDLPYLPYTLMKWYCMVDGCTCSCRVRDYGIPPLYYWPVKIHRGKDGSWRGGWTTCFHGYVCSKHFKELRQIGEGAFFRKHAGTWEYLTKKIVIDGKKRKPGIH